MKGMSCLVLMLISMSANASLGPSTGSGNGYVIVCEDAAGESSAQLLDLAEAVERYHLSLPAPSGFTLEDYARSIRNTFRLRGLDPKSADAKALNDLNHFMDLVQWSAQPLTRLNDYGDTIPIPRNCHLEPVAIFHDDTNTVEVNSDLWMRMDSLSQAALVTHEIFYHIERGLDETTSEETRLTVANIYSNSDIPPVNQGLPTQNLMCVTSGPSATQASQFYAYPSSDGQGTELQFSMIMGREVITKTTVAVAAPFLGEFTQVAESGHAPVQTEVYHLITRNRVSGSYGQEWEVEAVARAGEPIDIRLYEKGKLVAEAPVTSCTIEKLK